MGLLDRCKMDPMALGQIRRVALRVLQPLFELRIETLDDLLTQQEVIISSSGLRRWLGSDVKRHKLSLNRISLLLSHNSEPGEDPSRNSSTADLSLKQRTIVNSHLLADVRGATALHYRAPCRQPFQAAEGNPAPAIQPGTQRRTLKPASRQVTDATRIHPIKKRRLKQQMTSL